MRIQLLLLPAAAITLVLGQAGVSSAAWNAAGTGLGGARAAALAPPTGLTVAQSCTPTRSPGTTTATIAYRDGNSSVGAGSVTAARPAAVEGDLLLALYAVQSATLPTAPAGWTYVNSLSHSTAGSLTVALYTRLATASEPSSWTWTSTVTSRAAMTIAAYSGVDTASPVNDLDALPGAGSGITAPSSTPTVASTRLVGAFAIRADAVVVAPSAMAGRTSTTSGSGAAAVALAVADEAWPAATATGTRIATAATGGDNIGALIALAPKVTSHDGTITFHGSTTATGASSVAITSPAGVQVGDLLLVGFAKRADATLAISTPTGWTRLRSDDAGASDYRQTVFWRLATSADPGGTPYTFTSSSAGNAAAVLLVYRGVDQTNPLLSHSGQVSTGTNIAAASIAPSRTDARLVGVFGTQGAGVESTAPAGMTKRHWIGITKGKAADQVGVTLFDEPWPSDAATGSRTAVTNKAVNNVGQLVALKARSLPQVSLTWTPSASAFADGYNIVLASNGSPAATAVLTPASTATYDTGTLTPGGSYQIAVTTRAHSWRSTPAAFDLTATTQC